MLPSKDVKVGFMNVGLTDFPKGLLSFLGEENGDGDASFDDYIEAVFMLVGADDNQMIEYFHLIDATHSHGFSVNDPYTPTQPLLTK